VRRARRALRIRQITIHEWVGRSINKGTCKHDRRNRRVRRAHQTSAHRAPSTNPTGVTGIITAQWTTATSVTGSTDEEQHGAAVARERINRHIYQGTAGQPSVLSARRVTSLSGALGATRHYRRLNCYESVQHYELIRAAKHNRHYKNNGINSAKGGDGAAAKQALRDKCAELARRHCEPQRAVAMTQPARPDTSRQ
jgi:hypothetical protein